MYNIGDKVKVHDDQIMIIYDISYKDNINPHKGRVVYFEGCFIDETGEPRDWCYESEIKEKVGR